MLFVFTVCVYYVGVSCAISLWLGIGYGVRCFLLLVYWIGCGVWLCVVGSISCSFLL